MKQHQSHQFRYQLFIHLLHDRLGLPLESSDEAASMRLEAKPVLSVVGLSALVVLLALVFSSTVLHAQDDEPVEEPTLEELKEQREILAEEAAAAASSVDAASSNVEEIEQALKEMAELSNIHEIRLGEATARYDSAVEQFESATNEREEILAEIAALRIRVGELSVAAFTGESHTSELEVALTAEPAESARFLHLLGQQFGDVADTLDRLRLVQIQAEVLLVERDDASRRAAEELVEIEFRTGELAASIGEQEELLMATKARLVAERSEADSLTEQTEALELLIAEEEQRLEDAIRGVGAPAPVDREDIVLLTFFEGDGTVPVFQILVHKDIEAQTRGLYELAFSEGINLGGWGYRTTDRQIELREAHCGSSSYDIWLRPAGQCSPPTARPGFSKHEQGRAIDFQWNGGSIGSRSGRPFQWLAANAPQFGFVNLPSEPWHWSDGSAISSDPSVQALIPEDAFVEAEPDADTAVILADLGDVVVDGAAVDGTEAEPEDETVEAEADAADADTAETGDVGPAADRPEEDEPSGQDSAEPDAVAPTTTTTTAPSAEAQESTDPASAEAAPAATDSEEIPAGDGQAEE